jgi:putative ATP-binding cassette transporter
MVFRYLRKHRATLLITAGLSAVSAAVTLLLLRHIFDVAATGGRSHHPHPFIVGAGLMLALLVSSAASQALLARIEGDFVGQLRTELSQRFLDIEYESLLGQKQLVFGAIIEDIERIGPLVMLAPQLAYNLVLALGCLVYLTVVSASLFGIFVAFMVLTLGATLVVNQVGHARFDEMRAAEEKFFEHVRTISEAKKELSLNPARTSHFVEKLLHPTIHRARALMVRVHLLMGLNIAWSSVTVIGAVFTVVFVGQAVLGLALGTIIQFVFVAFFMLGPLNFIMQTATAIGRGMASIRHLERIGLDLQAEIGPPTTPLSLAGQSASWQHIRAEELSYRYSSAPESEPRIAVGPLNVEIPRGQLLFIIGGNGSGKSTLLLLLCGLLRPTTGQLHIDGRAVQDELARYRCRFGGVFGDFFLFPHVLDAKGSLVADDEVNALLHRLALSSQTSVQGGQLSTLSLSTGQRKRLALLQCYAEDREIYFFDEWAADQDASFRQHFYQVLLPELKRRGKTVIVISHDDRYFHVADRIIKLDHGLVVSDSSMQSPRNALAASE